MSTWNTKRELWTKWITLFLSFHAHARAVAPQPVSRGLRGVGDGRNMALCGAIRGALDTSRVGAMGVYWVIY